MSKFWENKTVWLIGASDGIGAALAKQLYAEKCELIISARNTEKLQTLANNSASEQAKVSILPLDLSNKESYTNAVEQFKADHQQLDVLIHCAGIAHKSLALETKEEVDRKVMEVNFMGIVQLTKQILPTMTAKNQGHIAVVSSILGEIGLPFVTTYAASKHALNGYFNSLRYELEKHNISVGVISPGFINTEITKKSLKGDGTAYNQNSDAQAKGMNVDKCALGIKRAIEKRKQSAYVGGVETNMPRVSRWMPRIFQKLMKKLHGI